MDGLPVFTLLFGQFPGQLIVLAALFGQLLGQLIVLAGSGFGSGGEGGVLLTETGIFDGEAGEILGENGGGHGGDDAGFVLALLRQQVLVV